MKNCSPANKNIFFEKHNFWPPFFQNPGRKSLAQVIPSYTGSFLPPLTQIYTSAANAILSSAAKCTIHPLLLLLCVQWRRDIVQMKMNSLALGGGGTAHKYAAAPFESLLSVSPSLQNNSLNLWPGPTPLLLLLPPTTVAFLPLFYPPPCIQSIPHTLFLLLHQNQPPALFISLTCIFCGQRRRGRAKETDGRLGNLVYVLPSRFL